MKTTLCAIVSILGAFLAAGPSNAEQIGLFSYEVGTGGTVSITGYPENATGAVDIPGEIDGYPVTRIGAHAFAGCAGLTSVSIPDGVDEIQAYAFVGCSGLATVSLSSTLTAIGNSAFERCAALARVDLPPTLTTIGWYAFFGCDDLTEITIPKSVVRIGRGAFYGCHGLTTVEIPAGVHTIELAAFADCRALTSIRVEPGNLFYVSLDGVLFDRTLNRLHQYPAGRAGDYVVPESVTHIVERAFSGCSALTSIAFPTALEEIEALAFAECVSLAQAVIPEGVARLGGYAFSGCTALTETTLPASLAFIGENAFGSCPGLRAIQVTEGNANFASRDGVLFDVTQTQLMRYPAGKAGPYAIPAGVTSIAEGAFRGCLGITSVTIPSSTAEGATFLECPNLTSILVQEGHPSFSSVDGVLFNASKTRLHQYPGGRSGSYIIPHGTVAVEGGGFTFNPVLTSVTIPATLISHIDFFGCTGLTSIHVEDGNPRYSSRQGALFNAGGNVLLQYPRGKSGDYALPEGVVKIEEGAFFGCEGLSGLSLPSSLVSLGDLALSGCSRLRSIIIPRGVAVLGIGVFSRCTSLQGVVIPAGISILGSGIFDGCTALRAILFQGDVPVDVHPSALSGIAPGYSVYFTRGTSGYSFPVWQHYLVTEIDPAAHPAAPWLITHGLPYQASLAQKAVGNGLSLLLNYALNLDPNDTAEANLPEPALDNERLSLRFFASAPGIDYSVETSGDLARWTTEGVSLSGPDSEGRFTASVPRSGTGRFLRLTVKQR